LGVMKMVRTRNAVLLRTRKTELAPPTDAAREPDPDLITRMALFSSISRSMRIT
jgi:hypothetical protein